MAMITPNVAFVRRLIPGILLEGVALVVCVLGFVYTESSVWIFLAGLIMACFAAWVIVSLYRNRHEWRWNPGPLGGRDKRL